MISVFILSVDISFIVAFDDKALEPMFDNLKMRHSARAECESLTTQHSIMKVRYCPGADNPADFLSSSTVRTAHN